MTEPDELASGGLLVVRRYRGGGADPVSRGAAKRPNALSLPSAEVLAKYEGIDAIHLMEEGEHSFASLEHLPRLLKACLRKGEQGEVIYVAPAGAESGSFPDEAGFVFRGYDYGVCVPGADVYSVIFHEVLFGRTDLRLFAERLNEHLLVSDVGLCADLSERRRRLVADGCDLETFEAGDGLRIWSVWGVVALPVDSRSSRA